MKKNLYKIAVLCTVSSLLYGCGSKEDQGAAVGNTVAGAETSSAGEKNIQDEAGEIIFTDALGNEVTVENPLNVAVLSGSYAEAWQLAGGRISAATEDAKENMEVTEDMVMLGALKSPSIELMIAEGIDFAILSSAISEHVDIRDTLEKSGIKTAYFEVETFSDYDNMMKICTKITGRQDLYQKNVEDIRSIIEAQRQRADGSSPSVLFLRAYSTGVKAKGSDSMTGEMLKDLGCVNIADNDKGLLKDLSMEAIIDADPDFIFVTTMGESEEDAMNMVQKLLLDNPAWNGLKAVTNEQYYVLPKELFHTKPNAHWGESYSILADYLYGEQ